MLTHVEQAEAVKNQPSTRARVRTFQKPTPLTDQDWKTLLDKSQQLEDRAAHLCNAIDFLEMTLHQDDFIHPDLYDLKRQLLDTRQDQKNLDLLLTLYGSAAVG